MGKRYQNPPVVEAVCEIRFLPNAEWDLTVPGLVYEKVSKDFPKKRSVKLQQLIVQRSPEGLEQTYGTSDGMRFLKDDEKTFIQVARDMLSVNCLHPYPSWETFFPLIQQAVRVYRKVAVPKGIGRIGLRYVNRVEIPGESVKMENYFHFYPFLGPDLPQEFGPFQIAVAIPYEEMRDILRLRAETLVDINPGHVGVTLDLDYFSAQPGKVELENAFEWLQVAHGWIEKVFEACITDRLREMFGEVTA